MGKKYRKLTPEDEARFERTTQMVQKRIAERLAKQHELDAAREREQQK